MPGILWGSVEEKEREWLFAKEKLSVQGELLPNGTKLRRKDHPELLNHSFMIMDGRIIALSRKGFYLGSGRDAHAKLAEDKAGNLIALKIITSDISESNLIKESKIAYDLGIAGRHVTRSSVSKTSPTKHYIAYQYLGTRLIDYLNANKSLSLDKRYELCIKISLALHEIHTGKKTKSKNAYQHNDIHWGNLVIDDQGEPHFIDFGRAWEADDQNESDIVSMLLLFYTPLNDRDCLHEDWIFGNWIGEYNFSYSPPEFEPEEKQYYLKKDTIYLYLSPFDQNSDGSYSIIHYAVLDPDEVFREGGFNLNDIGLDNITPRRKQLSIFDLKAEKRTLIEKAILELTNRTGYTLGQKNKNETLFNLLKNPTVFCRASNVPTALDIAETLTVCRLQLESYQDSLKVQSADVRLEIIQILNSISPELLKLYEQLSNLPSTDSLAKLVKNYIFSQLLTCPNEISEDSIAFLKVQLDETHTLKQGIDNILINLNHAKEFWRAKNAFISHDEPVLQCPQSKSSEVIELEGSSTEVISTVGTKSVVDQLATIINHESKPQTPIPIVHQESETKSLPQPIQLASKPDGASTIVFPECLEPPTQEEQTNAEHSISQAEQTFLREFKNLQKTIEEHNLLATSATLTIKQHRALKTALEEAKHVMKELKKQPSLTAKDDEAMLIRLADICSHTSQGLRFVANGGVTFACDLFYATSTTSGTLRQVNYDSNIHKSSMEHLSNMASSLEGSGWKKLRNTLLLLAGLMLIACGIFTVIPTGGTSVLLGLGGAAVLTAGIGFFAGRDTALAGAVSNVQMNVPPK